MKKRYFASRPKNLPKGYDSKLEHRLHTTVLKDCQHHCSKQDLVHYSIPHTYEYDFIVEDGDTLYLIETKGRFRDSAEASKYKHIRDHLVNWLDTRSDTDCIKVELIFIFENAKTPYPFAKVRKKCGTKQTHGEWATKNKFRWLCEKSGDLEGVECIEDLLKKLESKC